MCNKDNSGPINAVYVNKFDEENAQKFRECMIKASSVDANMPIIIYIDSYGGQVDSLLKMLETMDEIPNLKITVAMGKAMSCGAVLLSHGDVRFCGKHSRVMIHEISGGTFGNVHDMNIDVQEMGRMNLHVLNLLAINCGFKNAAELRLVLKQIDGTDLYLDAEGALKFGIIDAVGLPKVIPRAIYEVVAIPPKQEKRKKVMMRDDKEAKDLGKGKSKKTKKALNPESKS